MMTGVLSSTRARIEQDYEHLSLLVLDGPHHETRYDVREQTCGEELLEPVSVMLAFSDGTRIASSRYPA